MKESHLIAVSACLAGIHCKYNGGHNKDERVVAMVEAGMAMPLCPEVLGQLPIPRQPCEQVIGPKGEIRVMTAQGRDDTDQFKRGAEITLAICQVAGIREALLQERSPSCGCGKIYDGTFSGQLIDGDGLTTSLLKSKGIKVMTIKDFPFHFNQKMV